jgi:hypothetical protein
MSYLIVPSFESMFVNLLFFFFFFFTFVCLELVCLCVDDGGDGDGDGVGDGDGDGDGDIRRTNISNSTGLDSTRLDSILVCPFAWDR